VNQVDDPSRIYGDSRKIGEGAAGEVFLAVDTRTHRKIAIKKMVLNQQNTKLIATEIQIMKTTRHPAVVEFFDSFIVDKKVRPGATHSLLQCSC
jgi:serine/threonine protein kinase